MYKIYKLEFYQNGGLVSTVGSPDIEVTIHVYREILKFLWDRGVEPEEIMSTCEVLENDAWVPFRVVRDNREYNIDDLAFLGSIATDGDGELTYA